MAISECKEAADLTYANLCGSVYSILGARNGFLAFFIGLLSIILGVDGFSWLHNKRKVDFYHSLPIKREKLFFVHFLDGLLILFFSYGVNLLFSFMVTRINGIAFGAVLPIALTAFGFFMLHFVLMYCVTVLSMMLTGNILVGILGTGVLHLYFPALLVVHSNLFQTFFQTSYNGGSSSFMTFFMDKCSALTLFLNNYSILVSWEKGNLPLRLILVFLVIVVLTALSLILYRLRGSEAAGKAMAFKFSKPIIRIPLVILAGVSGGTFLWYLHASMGWAIFGMLCGLLLMHCVMEIIYHFDIKKLFSNRVSLVACAIATALIFCFFRYDLSGYDRYIPKLEALKSVAVSFPHMDYWVDYGSVEKGDNGKYYWDGEVKDVYLFSHMNLSDKAAVLSLVKEASDEIKLKKEDERRGVADTGDYEYFSVKFTLKNGKTVYRTYSTKNVYGLLQKIYDSSDYRMAAFPVLEQTPEETAKVKLSTKSMSQDVTRGGERDYVNLLLSAYQEELKGLTAKMMEGENPIAKIQFMNANQAAAGRKNGLWSQNSYPVYPSFTKTVALLKECGIDLNAEIEGRGIVAADFDFRRNDTHVKYGDDDHDVSPIYTVTDAKELKQLMKVAVLEDFSDMNPFQKRVDQISFEATVLGTSGQKKQEYSIQRKDAPDFLIDALNQYLEKSGIN